MKIVIVLLLILVTSCSRSIRDTTLKLGTGNPSNTEIISDQGLANNPKILYDFSLGVWRISNDGTSFSDIATLDTLTTYATLTDLDGYVTLDTTQTISGSKTMTGQFVAVSSTFGNRPCPVMTQTDRNAIVSPQEGDCIINSDTNQLNFYLAGAWGEVAGGGESGLPLLQKGSIITSDGTNNGEFTACANGEVIEWDSAEASGIKCSTKGSNIPLLSAGQLLVGDGSTFGTFNCPNGQVAVYDSGQLYGFSCEDNNQTINDFVTSKGNLLTNDGTNQVEHTACADGQIIEWDSADPDGIKCIPTPAGGGGGSGASAIDFFRHVDDHSSTSNSQSLDFAFSKNYTVTAGSRVRLTCSYDYVVSATFDSNNASTDACNTIVTNTTTVPTLNLTMAADSNNQAYFLNTDFNEISTFFDVINSSREVSKVYSGSLSGYAFNNPYNANTVVTGNDIGDSTTACQYRNFKNSTLVFYFIDSNNDGSISFTSEFKVSNVGVPSGFTFLRKKGHLMLICQVDEITGTVIDL